MLVGPYDCVRVRVKEPQMGEHLTNCVASSVWLFWWLAYSRVPSDLVWPKCSETFCNVQFASERKRPHCKRLLVRGTTQNIGLFHLLSGLWTIAMLPPSQPTLEGAQFQATQKAYATFFSHRDGARDARWRHISETDASQLAAWCFCVDKSQRPVGYAKNRLRVGSLTIFYAKTRRSSHLLLCSRLPYSSHKSSRRWSLRSLIQIDTSWFQQTCRVSRTGNLSPRELRHPATAGHRLGRQKSSPVGLHSSEIVLLLPLLPMENPVWNGSKNDWKLGKT